MKHHIPIAIAGLTIAALALTAGDTTRYDSPNRYTILNAQVTLEITFSETRTEGMLIRFDTHTGQTWRYQHTLYPIRMDNGKIAPLLIEGWTLIPDNFVKEFATTRSSLTTTNNPPPYWQLPRRDTQTTGRIVFEDETK